MRAATILLFAALISPAPALRAQAAPALAQALQPGARVRVTAPAAGLAARTATVRAVRGDTLLVRSRPAGAPTVTDVAVPLALVERLEVSRGRRHHVWRGVAVGLIAGAAAGAVLGFAQGDTGDFLFPSAEEKAALFATLLTPVGGLVGLAVGCSTGAERWEPVPLGGTRVGAGAAPRRAGLALRVAVAF